MPIIRSFAKVTVGLFFGRKLAMLDTFFKISTSNLLCSTFTLRLIGKPNWKLIGPKMTILASKSLTNGHILILFLKVSVTQNFVTSATINIFP